MVLAFHKSIHQVEHWRHAAFVGFFGPIGVSAIFYLYISKEFLREIIYAGHERADAEHLAEVIDVVVWFLAICSIVVHGLSIPLGKLGIYLPRTISEAMSSERVSRSPSQTRSHRSEDEPVTPHPMDRMERSLVRSFRRRRPTTTERGPATASGFGGEGVVKNFFGAIRRVTGRSTISDSRSDKSDGGRPDISGPMNGRVLGKPITVSPPAHPDTIYGDDNRNVVNGLDVSDHPVPHTPPQKSEAQTPARSTAAGPVNSSGLPSGWQRSIRFPDENMD